MISNYTKNITVSTTGALILEFDIEEMDSLIITPTADIYIGFSDLSQAVFPILASASFAMSHQDFKNQTMEKIYALLSKFLLKININVMPAQKIVRIYAKGQIANSTISINYLGGNR